MKRPLLFAILIVFAAVVLAVLPALGAPSGQETRPVIVAPTADAAVRDAVQVIGTATHPQFQRYELYYAPSPVPSDQSWIFVGDAHFAQQPLGLLGVWDSRSVPDGAYALRVRVVKADGNYIDSDARRVIVANTRPPETPTPAEPETPLPELPPTEAPAAEGAAVVSAPTGVVAIPTIAPTATRDVTSVPESEITPFVSTSTGGSAGGGSGANASGEGATSVTGQLFSSGRLLDTARKAATYTVLAFLLVGAFFALKAILVWLWYRIKP